MDPFDPFSRPEFLLLLLLEQGDRSLEDHIRLFLVLANHTSYPDDALYLFYDTSFNTSKALSSEDVPQESFAAFVEWILPDPLPKPTADRKPELAETTEPPPHGAPKPRIAAELVMSVQVCEQHPPQGRKP
ncbi:hypothetical protein M9458_043091, partial [Cirrhinus mrigala]